MPTPIQRLPKQEGDITLAETSNHIQLRGSYIDIKHGYFHIKPLSVNTVEILHIFRKKSMYQKLLSSEQFWRGVRTNDIFGMNLRLYFTSCLISNRRQTGNHLKVAQQTR